MYEFIILKNEFEDDHDLWIRACENFKDKVTYKIVDLTKDKWLEQLNNKKFDYLLAKPGG